MRTFHRLAAVAMLTMATQSTVTAQQFYNGDFDDVDGVWGAITSSADGIIFENFTVGGSGLYVTQIFGQYLADFNWTTASWEVRSGITTGNGGTLLFSGVDAASQVFAGSSPLGYDVYTATVSGLGFFLAPGEYWFGLAPMSAGSGAGYLATTSGAGGINANLDQSHFMRSASFGYDYEEFNETYNFSVGIDGRLSESTVPEPATMTLLATGLAGLASARRRKRSNA